MKILPQISVLMPIYNTAPQHLRVAIESILNQTFTNFEFIILNDSPDNRKLKSIIMEYSDTRIRYEENHKTLGIPKSYNRLVDLSSTNYLAIMNHDDYSFPNRLQIQYQYLESHPEVGIVGSGYKKFGEINRFKKIYPLTNDADIKSMLLFKSSLHHPTVMMRKNILIENSIRYNENYISLNDRQLYYDIRKYSKLANLSDILYKYRFHKNMTSKRKKNIIFIEQCEFHNYWFEDNDIDLTPIEKTIFNCYASSGRCQIKDFETLEQVKNVLEKISSQSLRRSNIPQPEFAKICANYLLKRMLNAAVYGYINSDKILQNTTLPIKADTRIKLLNLALKWRN